MKMKNFLKCCEDLVIQESGASALELEKLKAKKFPQAHLDLLSMTNAWSFMVAIIACLGQILLKLLR